MNSITRVPYDLREKYAAEAYALLVDFSVALLPTDRLDFVDVSIDLVAGNDSSPAQVIAGGATNTRFTVSQFVEGGVPGAVYEITFTARTIMGETHTVVARLPVI